MVRNFVAPFLLLASFTVPVQALPTYATLIARSHCQYLAYGTSWDDAMSQSFRDYDHWMDEITRDGNMAYRAIQIAIDEECPTLNDRAWTAYDQSR